MIKHSQSSQESTLNSLAIKKSGTQEIKIYNNQIKLKEDEKNWDNGDNCVICESSFNKLDLQHRQHHCRVCGKPVCKKCSDKTVNQKRACDLCFKRIQLVDQEKRKQEQIKDKAKFIEQLKQQINSTKDEKELLLQELETLKKNRQISLLQQKIHIKQLDDTLIQRTEQFNMSKANNERQEKNIQVEKGQIRESEMQNEDLRNQISKLKININQLLPLIEPKKIEIDHLNRQLEDIRNRSLLQESKSLGNSRFQPEEENLKREIHNHKNNNNNNNNSLPSTKSSEKINCDNQMKSKTKDCQIF